MNLKHVTICEPDQRDESRFIEPRRESGEYKTGWVDDSSYSFNPKAVATQFLLSAIEIELEL